MALALEFGCGGWCPAGRRAEDGPIPERYPVVELAGADYRARTTRNVLGADATLILGYGALGGGTRQTRRDCVRFGKPFLVVDGPRESNWPGARGYTEETVRELIGRSRRARFSA